MTDSSKPQAEKDAVTPPSIAQGLGFPLDRKETSPEPTGWQIPVGADGETTEI
jgi:hypothetical protein